MSLYRFWKDVSCFLEEAESLWSSLHASPTWKKGKLSFPHLCVFEATTLTSVGFLCSCMANWKDKFDLQSVMHRHSIYSYVCSYFMKGRG